MMMLNPMQVIKNTVDFIDRWKEQIAKTECEFTWLPAALQELDFKLNAVINVASRWGRADLQKRIVPLKEEIAKIKEAEFLEVDPFLAQMLSAEEVVRPLLDELFKDPDAPPTPRREDLNRTPRREATDDDFKERSSAFVRPVRISHSIDDDETITDAQIQDLTHAAQKGDVATVMTLLVALPIYDMTGQQMFEILKVASVPCLKVLLQHESFGGISRGFFQSLIDLASADAEKVELLKTADGYNGPS